MDSSTISHQIEDPRDILPYELWYLAMKNLSPKDILSLCQTSKEFAELCKGDYMWKVLLQKDYKVKWAREGAKKEYIRLSIRPMVSCGSNFTGFVTKDKTLYMWGNNNYSQLGDGTVVRRHKPTYVKIKGNQKIVKVSCGYSHTGAITEDGNLYMWGQNLNGQLGDGTTITKDKPTYVKIKGNPQIIKVSCGGYHTGAITEDGSLYMWGFNRNGQVGDGSTVNKSKPVLIKIKGNPRFVKVSCGESHTGAVTEDGNLYMWGSNRSYELGDGTRINRNKPVFIMERVAQVSCGGSHNGAVTKDGSLYMWGSNYWGQLGDGSTDKIKPTLVKIEENLQIIQVSCGQDFTGVVAEDSSLYMWGRNSEGELGDGTKIDKNKPIFIMGGIFKVSCGRFHTGVITKNDELYMWGDNKYGQLGEQPLKRDLEESFSTPTYPSIFL